MELKRYVRTNDGEIFDTHDKKHLSSKYYSKEYQEYNGNLLCNYYVKFDEKGDNELLDNHYLGQIALTSDNILDLVKEGDLILTEDNEVVSVWDISNGTIFCRHYGYSRENIKMVYTKQGDNYIGYKVEKENNDGN